MKYLQFPLTKDWVRSIFFRPAASARISKLEYLFICALLNSNSRLHVTNPVCHARLMGKVSLATANARWSNNNGHDRATTTEPGFRGPQAEPTGDDHQGVYASLGEDGDEAGSAIPVFHRASSQTILRPVRPSLSRNVLGMFCGLVLRFFPWRQACRYLERAKMNRRFPGRGTRVLVSCRRRQIFRIPFTHNITATSR